MKHVTEKEKIDRLNVLIDIMVEKRQELADSIDLAQWELNLLRSDEPEWNAKVDSQSEPVTVIGLDNVLEFG